MIAMHTVRVFRFILLVALCLPLTLAYAKVYRWVDADGNVVYGDNPPKASKAKTVDLPSLTIADGFVPQAPQEPPTSTPAAMPPQADPNAGMQQQEEAPAYSEFKVSSPGNGETLQTNGGLLPVTISLTPGLKSGDGITVYLDSKQVAHDTGLAFQIPEVVAGEHSLFAVLTDSAGNIIQNTETVRFTLLQRSKAVKK
jgi:hypothetical protein